MNRYSYCFNNSTVLVDLDGAWPSLSDIGNGLKDIGKVVITSVSIVGIGVASVATGGAAGGLLQSVMVKTVGKLFDGAKAEGDI